MPFQRGTIRRPSWPRSPMRVSRHARSTTRTARRVNETSEDAHVITLGSLSFSGPFLAPLWAAPKSAGLYAVLVPGWKLMTFRALYFGQADVLDTDVMRSHSRLAEWRTIAGTEWNLYIATHEMSFSTPAQREAAAREL